VHQLRNAPNVKVDNLLDPTQPPI